MKNKFKLVIIIIIILILIYVYSLKISNYHDFIELINEKIDKRRIDYKIERYGSNETRNITVIACYFKIQRSKHNHKKYEKWMIKFLASVSSPLVLFTSEASFDRKLLKFRQNYPTTLYKIDSHWSILKNIEQLRNKTYIKNYKSNQFILDPEKIKHNSDLYVIWNMKSFLVNKIAQLNPYNSNVFIYSDIGAWRNEIIIDWPNESVVENLMHILNNRILFGQISNSKIKKLLFYPQGDFIEGGFFMGNKNAIQWFENNFWNLHDSRMKKNYFIGKDETLMNLLAFEPKTMYSIVRLNADNDCTYERWFFYQYFLASNYYYECFLNRNKLLMFS